VATAQWQVGGRVRRQVPLHGGGSRYGDRAVEGRRQAPAVHLSAKSISLLILPHQNLPKKQPFQIILFLFFYYYNLFLLYFYYK
jgi:hypothetical protein